MNEIVPVTTLHEPSLADAIAMIEQDPDLASSTRTHWLCSIRRIAEAIGRPLELLPARMTALRHPVSRLNAARLGMSPKTLANHKSNLRTALNHLAGQDAVASRGAPLSPPWANLLEGVTDPWARKRIIPLFRYVSARGLEPNAVDDGVLRAFFAHREQTTFLDVSAGRRREIARVWNACADTVPGFPRNRLTVEPRDSGPEWEAYPQGFRDEVETYLETLRHPRRSASGRRRPACKPSTIKTRRREIVAATRMAVSLGVPVNSLARLRDLLVPDVAGRVLDAYWARNGERPETFVIDLAGKFCAIAHATGCLSEAEFEQLDDMRHELEQYRRSGLTEKNLKVVRAVLSTDIWCRVVRLPDRMMADAYRFRSTSPKKAAVLAALAVAIRILTHAPVRVGNLAAISLDTNLIRPGGLDGPYWLTFPDYEVKNDVDLNFPFDEEMSAFIDGYIRDFRPTLLQGSNEPWLFPGGTSGGRHKRAGTLSSQITKRIEREIGFRITAHQFRHAAAALILQKHPGNYELVRRVLAHRNIQTTINFYIGLESMSATQTFGTMILNLARTRDGEED